MKKLFALLFLGCATIPALDLGKLDDCSRKVQSYELPEPQPVEPHIGMYRASFFPNSPKLFLAQPFVPAVQGQPVSFRNCITLTGLGTSTFCNNVDSNYTYLSGSLRTQGGNGIYIEAGNMVVAAGLVSARSATGGISVGSAGTEYFGIAAGGSSINIGGVLTNATGFIQANSGTGSGQAYYLGGNICAVSTAVGNVTTSGPDDLQTCTLSANTLLHTGRGIRITAFGTCANNANAKTFTLNFGSQVILTHACTASVAGETWRISSEVLRTGSSTQDWFSTYFGNTGTAAAFEYDPEIGTATQTETGSIVVKMQTTTTTSTNDVVEEGLYVEYL